jgi:hypothetical protein
MVTRPVHPKGAGHDTVTRPARHVDPWPEKTLPDVPRIFHGSCPQLTLNLASAR